MKKELFYLCLTFILHSAFYIQHCFAQGDTAWIHDTGDNATRCVRISPDGQYVAAGLESGTITLFSADSGNVIRTFPNIVKYPSLCFSPNGEWLACGGTDSLIYIWDVESATLSKTFTQTNGPQLWSIDISPDGKYLLGTFDSLRLWDLENDSLILTTSSWFYTKFSPNGKYFANPLRFSVKDKIWTDIYIYSMDSLKVCAVFYNLPWQMNDMATSPLAWSPTGDTLAVASGDSLIYFIDIPQKSFVDTLHLTYGDYPIRAMRYYKNNIITGGGGFFNYSTGIYYANNKERINGYIIIVDDLDIDSSGTFIIYATGDVNTSSYCLLMLHSNYFFSSVFDVPENDKNYFRLYPNPTNDMANLEYNSSKADCINLSIYDYLGNQKESIYSGFLDAGEHVFNLQFKDYPCGIYYIVINYGKKKRIIKFVIER